MEDNILLALLIGAVVAVVIILSVGITYGGHIQDQKIIDCIKAGSPACECGKVFKPNMDIKCSAE